MDIDAMGVSDLMVLIVGYNDLMIMLQSEIRDPDEGDP